MDDNFFGDVRRLAHHRLFRRLMHFDGALLECTCGDASFARRDRPTAFHAYRLITKRDLLFDRPVDNVAADCCGATVNGVLADLQFLLGKRDDLFFLTGCRLRTG